MARSLVVAIVVKQCASDREVVLDALRALFTICGGDQTVLLLIKAIQAEPRVIAVTNKGHMSAVELLCKAAERKDWKKFKSAARQLAK